jgi:cystathionine gamma-synthase
MQKAYALGTCHSHPRCESANRRLRFPYTDTLKILQKWGAGCHHFGNGDTDDLKKFEELLASSPPRSIACLFCEFPSNPLLRSAPLKELRRLADQYDFLLVVDDTIGNFVNVEVLPYADMVVSGLTKVFSGDANVMGGRCDSAI